MPNFNLSISPPQLELIIKPGTTFIQAYTITNNSDTILYLTTSVEPWQPIGSDGSVSYANVFPNPNISFTLANSDLTLGQTFSLPPNQKKQIVLKIKPSESTPIADSYYTFFISQDTSNLISIGGNQAKANAKIGSHILLTTSNTDQIAYQFKVTNFNITPKFKDILFTPINFSAKIANNTNHFFKPSGKITISKNNLAFKELDILPQNVLANNQRQIICQKIINTEAGPEPTATNCTLTPPLWPGHYTATIKINETSATSSATINFFVFPFSPLIFILSTVLIIFLAIKIKNKFISQKPTQT